MAEREAEHHGALWRAVDQLRRGEAAERDLFARVEQAVAQQCAYNYPIEIVPWHNGPVHITFRAPTGTVERPINKAEIDALKAVLRWYGGVTI